MAVTPAILLPTRPEPKLKSKPLHSKSVHFVIEPPSLSKFGSQVSSAEKRDMITESFDVMNSKQPSVVEPLVSEVQQVGAYPKDGESIYHRSADSLVCVDPGKFETDPDRNGQVDDPLIDQQLLSCNDDIEESQVIETI
jgi:hypothetical protein